MGGFIKFIYFDIGGVLFCWKSSLLRLAEDCGKEYGEFEKLFQKFDSEACRGRITAQELWRRYKNDSDFQFEILDFSKYWVDNFIPTREVYDLVIRLSRSYKIGILSNIYKGTFEKLIDRNILPKIKYDSLILSCDLGYIKPENEFFDYAIKESGVKPYEILYIDDSKINIDKAIKLGWKTVLFDENNVAHSIKKINKLLGI